MWNINYLKIDRNQWLFSKYDGIEANFELGSIETAIALSDIYDKVNFESAK